MSRGLFVVALIATWFAGTGRANQPIDLSGTWSASVDMGSVQGMQTWVFKQQGDRLSGTANRGEGERKVNGSVKGDKAVFGFEAAREGRVLKAAFRGTIESRTKMSGTVEFTGSIAGTGTWTATRK
jgi:hypothetical protein